MPTLTPSSDEMRSRTVRFDAIQPKKARLDAGEGVPAELLEKIAANAIYLYMAPAGMGGTNQNPGITGPSGLTVNVCRCPPGDGPLLHAHDRTTETFMTIKGAFDISWGDRGEHSTRLNAFDMISIPPKVMRTFRNTENEESVLLVLIQGDNRDVAADIQYAPEVGMDVERDYGIAARKKLESFGWRFDAQLGSKQAVE